MVDLECEFKPFYVDWLKTFVDPYYDKELDPEPRFYIAWWAADRNVDTAIQALLNCDYAPNMQWWIETKKWFYLQGFGGGLKTQPINKFTFDRAARLWLVELGRRFPECDKEWRKSHGKT